MKKSLLLATLLSLLLAGCSSTPINDASKPSGPVSASSNAVDDSDLDLASLRDPNNILSKRSIYFDYDKDVVKAEYKDLVAAHAKYVSTHPNAIVTGKQIGRAHV